MMFPDRVYVSIGLSCEFRERKGDFGTL